MRRFAICLSLLACLAPASAFSQGVGINSSAAPADTSALLDLSSTIKGFLPPRMTSAQRTAIPLPATGLVVYQTDGTAGLYYNFGTPLAPSWKLLTDSGSLGNLWLSSGPNLYYNLGNVGVGTSSFAGRLTVIDSLNGLRVQANYPGGALASFGGVGTFKVDAPFIVGGRLAVLENGNMGVGRTAPLSRLDVLGGNFDVVNTEGDLRVGSDSYRLKIGVATTGGGAGVVHVMQQGVPGGYNVLALGSQGNDVLYVNGNTQHAGIGTDSPNAPLGFPASLGKKITLYPGATGDAGFAMAGNRLQIYADNPNADVAMGYDAAGTFNERFAVKPTGALAVNANVGAAGQVLQSNGGAAAATWVSPTSTLYGGITIIDSGNSISITDHAGANLPDLHKTLTVSATVKAIVSVNVVVIDPGCVSCGASTNQVTLQLDGTDVRGYIKDTANGARDLISFTDGIVIPAGTHTINVTGYTISGSKTMQFGDYGVDGNSLTIQVVPQ